MINNNIPEWTAEMCHPANKYSVDMVKDEIFTLEGIHAGMPYGSSSGTWGNSGKMWTEQHGTPIGADITYYAGYDNAFYRLKIDFPVEKMKDLIKRYYPTKEIVGKTIAEYKHEGDLGIDERSYKDFSSLVFGFAPKGMVVVWANYGMTVIEIGRYQAKVITETKELETAKNKHMAIFRFTPEYFDERTHELYIPNANCDLWDMYRLRYQWKPAFTSENPNFRLFEVNTEYYNGEKDQLMRPWLLENKIRDRALPSVFQFFWETSKDERFEGRIFFNQDQLFDRFKGLSGENEIQVKIANDNQSLKVLVNNETLVVDSIRIYPNSNWRFNDSYK
ncbi:DUF2931 family protein [Flavobacterium hydatis]|nr:DUF2931 family protein [Flavobacterium hydatis]